MDDNRIQLPVLPLGGTVLFPYQLMPLVVTQDSSVAAVEAALSTEEKTIVVASQQETTEPVPGFADLWPVATKAVIKKMARADNSMVQIIVQGIQRVEVLDVKQTSEYLEADVVPIAIPDDWDAESEALLREIMKLSETMLDNIDVDARLGFQRMIQEIENPLHRVYVLSTLLTLDVQKEQQILSAKTQHEAFRLVHEHLQHESQVQQLRKDIANQAQSEMGKEHREYLLRKQMRAIQDELGEQSPEQADVAELRERLEKAHLPKEVLKEAKRNLQRLERLPTASPDYQVTRSHIELICELPWNASTEDQLDLKRAREILDEDHSGLGEVKERIVEHLAVRKLNPDAKAPIICFVGPPGVGKTSLGKSVARSLGREFSRLSLGGLSDESELRGHRRTYVGAMPGRIIQSIRRVEVNNPLLMLDEIDKLGRDFRGDPSAALLEILDPAQNSEFRDNYLDLPFDLSKTFFIATANSLETIPQPLLDRMEIIRIAGYSDEEKVTIAMRYLLPRQLEQAGLSSSSLQLDENTIAKIVRHYTREAGVRLLEQTIGRLCRKVATEHALGKTEDRVVAADDLPELLGPHTYFDSDARNDVPPGVAAGLAWTPVGGEVLYVEAVALPDERTFRLTGQLGDVMKESAETARSLIHSQWAELDLDKQALATGMHIHVPAGATPKDGPSAGVTIATAIASLLTCKPVRSDTAMTGEITLSGLVLPVGGIKEKVLAAHRAGFQKVILPQRNEKDVVDIPEHVRNKIEIVFVRHIQDALSEAIPHINHRYVEV